MDIMEAGPSRPSSDPINDLSFAFGGRRRPPPRPRPRKRRSGAGTAPRARVANPGRIPVSDRPTARPASIGNSRGSRKPMASDRRDAADRGGALGFGDGGFRPYEPKPGGFDREAYQREYMQPRLRTPSPEPEPEPGAGV